MLGIVIKVLLQIASSDCAKQAIEVAADQLLNSKNDGIDKETVEKFVSKAAKSKLNKLTDDLVDEIVKKI